MLVGSLSCALSGHALAAPIKTPEKLAFFYAEPHNINGANGDTEKAAVAFADYDLVVFPENVDLEKFIIDGKEVINPSHLPAIEIIAKLKQNGRNTRVYGYVDLCWDKPGTSEYECTRMDQATLVQRVENWRRMGVAGIFLDQAGCDYGVTRQRQNDIIGYIHDTAKLSAFINVWNQHDAFSTERSAKYCNPEGLGVLLNANDYTLLESWALVEGEWSERRPDIINESLHERAQILEPYRAAYGTKIATVNTASKGNPPFDQRQLDYTWWSSVFYGFEAMAWGETWVYSSDTALLPFRARPNPPPLGDTTGPVTRNGDLYSRITTTGTLLLDTNGHSGRLTTKNVVTQAALRPTDLVGVAAVFSPTEVTFEVVSDLEPITNVQVFIDSDKNAATGYIHADEGLTAVGADYMVDNEDLYVFTGGAEQSTWSWQLVTPVTPTGLGTKRVHIPVALSQLGYNGLGLRMLAKNSNKQWKTLDFLPRAPTGMWTAKAAPFQQSGTNPGDLVSGNATFSEYKGTTQLTFTMQSNGGNIAGYRVMIDADNTAATGYPFWGLGVDYMIENGRFGRYDPDPTQPLPNWRWQGISNLTEIGDGGLGKPAIKASILPIHLAGYEPGKEMKIIMQHWLPDEASGYPSIDLMPRNGAGEWLVTHSGANQAETGDTLVFGDASYTASDVKVTFKSNGGPINSYRVFIDRDNAAATGYRHTKDGNNITGVGAEYMIQDGKLHQFCGTTATEWCWTFLSNNVTDNGYGTSQITAQFPKSVISYAPDSTLALVAENFISRKESLDLLLVRSASTVWRAKP